MCHSELLASGCHRCVRTFKLVCRSLEHSGVKQRTTNLPNRLVTGFPVVQAFARALLISSERVDRRDEFDLVVYYDQDAHSADWGPQRAKPPHAALRYLNDAIYDYSQEKPLRWAPILLNGGLDAWVELVGREYLQTSHTAAQPRDARTAPPIRRKSTLGSRLDIQKRRHREYNPLDAEEERTWRERARTESFVLDQRPSPQLQPQALEQIRLAHRSRSRRVT